MLLHWAVHPIVCICSPEQPIAQNWRQAQNASARSVPKLIFSQQHNQGVRALARQESFQFSSRSSD